MARYMVQLKDNEDLIYPITTSEAVDGLGELAFVDSPLSIDNGGTGATNAKNARVNLGLSKAVVYDTTTTTPTVNSLALLVYPVGSIYMSVSSSSPEILFGGTWEQIEDTFLLAAGSTYPNGSTGGEATHTLTESEMPKHRHNDNLYNSSSYGGGSNCASTVSNSGGANWTHYTDYMGGGEAHNNMPPYLAVYMWRRIA